MKNLVTIILVLVLSNSVYAQGADTCLNFDGTDDYVAISSLSTNVTASSCKLPTKHITVEAWVNPHTFSYYRGVVSFIQDNGSSEGGWVLGAHSTGQFFFGVESTTAGSSSFHYTFSTNSFPANKWYHIVGVYDGDTTRLYVNGILEKKDGRPSGDISYLDARFRIGRFEDDNQNLHFDGLIDEVRIWDTARTQTEIRNNMASKLIGNETGLSHYWKLDDGNDDTATSTTGNFNGSLENMSTADWKTSGAPIGDGASTLFTNNWVGRFDAVSSTDKGNIIVDSVRGTTVPDGIIIYQVLEKPKSQTGITPALGTSNIYYGVFVIGGSSDVKYRMTYNYANYPDAVSHEPNVKINERNYNGSSNWSTLTTTINTTDHTLIHTGVTDRGEFVISGSSSPLPIELISFKASLVTANLITLDWETATETDNDYFTIERSIDGSNWDAIEDMAGAGNSSSLLSYQILDYQPLKGISFYRLKQTDFNGDYSYSKTIRINSKLNTRINAFPNPCKDEITIQGNDLEINSLSILNLMGLDVSSKCELLQSSTTDIKLNLMSLTKGIYYVKINALVFKIEKN